MFRFFGGYSIGFFSQSYFLQNYKAHKDEYSYINAIVISICGFTSAMVGGVLSDHYERKGYYKIKAYVCIFAGVAGIPTIALTTLC